jgi:hypothetical protein
MFTLANLNRPIINILNNGQLSSVRAMPQKDSTSDGDSTFEMDRATYTRTFHHHTTNSRPSTSTTYNWKARRNVQQVTSLPTGTTSNYMNGKKWYGNRDASQVTANRRTTEVGVGSLNASNIKMAFQDHINYNTTNDALRRVRAGGAIAPAKKGAKRNNAPVPGFAPAKPATNSLISDLYGIKRPVLFH